MGRIVAISPYLVTAIVLGVLISFACSGGEDEPTLEQKEVPESIQITSSAFTDGAGIPSKYTCDGEDIPPQLAWTGIPDGTNNIALVVDDPDAPRGTWVHWVLYEIPPDMQQLPEGISVPELATLRVNSGKNDFGDLGYGGPCPPRGKAHRYFFKLYALDTDLALGTGADKEDLLLAMDGHILAGGQLMGKYQRK